MTPLDKYDSREEFEHTPILDTIDGPADVRRISEEQLVGLSDEIRRKCIATVSNNGGHLASSLGVVELTLALYHIFDLDRDKIIWDVGHQSYPHKLLTGRRDVFHTLRKKDGISGYPKRKESPYDSFDVGHSSTSISAALGIAIARDQRGDDNKVIAVIGDGAITAGMSLEALSHAGHVKSDLLVILNDNEMSISHSVGALSASLNRMITGGIYSRAREDIQSFMKRMLGKRVHDTARRLEHSVKGLVMPGGFFQEMGFHYFGPVDGHDFDTLIACLSNIKKLNGPILFHCVTQKGKGYKFAENNPQKFHGVTPYDIWTGEVEGEALPPDAERQVPHSTKFSDVLGMTVVEAVDHDPRVVGITAAMPTGTGLSRLAEKYPKNFFDVGICEQHAVTLAAGLATEGMRPVCAIYSTFFQRSYDQYIHDVCLQNLPVVFALDRGGLVGEDAPTHSGIFDLSFLRAIPNISVLAARDGEDLRAMVLWALAQEGPVAIRYPRGKATTIGEPGDRDISKAQLIRSGSDATFMAVGPCVGACIEAAEMLAAEGLSIGIVDARFIKPLDTEMLNSISHSSIVTVEENTLVGGFGSAVMEYFESKGRLNEVKIHRIGLPDEFDKHATRAEQLSEHGLDAEGLTSKIRKHIDSVIHHAIK